MKLLNFKLLFYTTLIAITVLSIIPTSISQKAEISNSPFRLDYFYHFIAYFFMGVFLLLWKYKDKLENRIFAAMILFGIFYSVVFELIQIFIPNRVFNPLDAIFNLSGFVFGIVGFLILRKQKKKVVV